MIEKLINIKLTTGTYSCTKIYNNNNRQEQNCNIFLSYLSSNDGSNQYRKRRKRNIKIDKSKSDKIFATDINAIVQILYFKYNILKHKYPQTLQKTKTK